MSAAVSLKFFKYLKDFLKINVIYRTVCGLLCFFMIQLCFFSTFSDQYHQHCQIQRSHFLFFTVWFPDYLFCNWNKGTVRNLVATKWLMEIQFCRFPSLIPRLQTSNCHKVFGNIGGGVNFLHAELWSLHTARVSVWQAVIKVNPCVGTF